MWRNHYFYLKHCLRDIVQQQIPAPSPFVTCAKVWVLLFLNEEEQSELCYDSKTEILTWQHERVGKQLGFQTVPYPTVFTSSQLCPSVIPSHVLERELLWDRGCQCQLCAQQCSAQQCSAQLSHCSTDSCFLAQAAADPCHRAKKRCFTSSSLGN